MNVTHETHRSNVNLRDYLINLQRSNFNLRDYLINLQRSNFNPRDYLINLQRSSRRECGQASPETCPGINNGRCHRLMLSGL